MSFFLQVLEAFENNRSFSVRKKERRAHGQCYSTDSVHSRDHHLHHHVSDDVIRLVSQVFRDLFLFREFAEDASCIASNLPRDPKCFVIRGNSRVLWTHLEKAALNNHWGLDDDDDDSKE